MNPLTIFYAQIIGIYVLVVSLAFIINPKKARGILEEAKERPSLPLIDGAMALIFGSIIILTHNLWGDALAITVSTLGWFSFVAGVFELLLPHSALKKILNSIPKKSAPFVATAFLLLAIFMLVKAFGIY